MAVRIGNACQDENRRAHGGVAGDQTGNEVRTQDWYSHPWHTVFRPNSSKVAEKIAFTMEKACANSNIGYDQYQRTTLYNEASKFNFDMTKVKIKVETDCSALVSCCVNAAGIPVSKDMYTGNETDVLSKTGKFTVLKDSKYTTSSNYLKRGDILLGNGHTAVVLTDGIKIPKKEESVNTVKITTKKATGVATSMSKEYKGTYKTTKAVNMRHNAGKTAKLMLKLPKDTKFKCYGYYSKSKFGNIWLYGEVDTKNTKYIGFVVKKYLKK